MRTIKGIHNAIADPVGDLITFRALPTDTIDMGALNPFIFLNHHGPQVYPAGNSGLPFGPHPHRGMETVTFILEGDIMHKDTAGHESVITSGGIQYMSAGRGIIHAETSSEAFKLNGGKLEIIQLWLNLPARYKMDMPRYKGFQKSEIPEIIVDEKIKANVISGKWEDKEGVFETVTGVHLSLIHFVSGGQMEIYYPAEDNIFFYLIRGELDVNREKCPGMQLIEFGHDEKEINIRAIGSSLLLLGSAPPLDEPIAANGPFVMNSQEDISRAYDDYKKGKFGKWKT